MAEDQAGWPAIPLLGSFEIIMPNQIRRDHLDLNRRKKPTRTRVLSMTKRHRMTGVGRDKLILMRLSLLLAKL